MPEKKKSSEFVLLRSDEQYNMIANRLHQAERDLFDHQTTLAVAQAQVANAPEGTQTGVDVDALTLQVSTDEAVIEVLRKIYDSIPAPEQPVDPAGTVPSSGPMMGAHAGRTPAPA